MTACIPKASEDISGASSFYVENCFEEDAVVVFCILGEEDSKSVLLKAGEVKEIYYLVEIGTNPTPESVLSALSISYVDGNLLYVQNPIENTKWSAKIENPLSKDYYYTKYYLTLE